jgi:hypothetical protein
MKKRQPIILLGLAAALVAPASASAATTVVATGDGGQPVPLTTTTVLGLRQMDVVAKVTVPATDATAYRTQVVDQAGTPSSDASPCRTTEFGTDWTNYSDYRGNGTYSVVVQYWANDACTGAPTRQNVYKFAINAGIGVTPPATKFLTRAPNSLITNRYEIGVGLNPGASSYEVRYALGGVVGPDGAISGPSAETFVNTASGLAQFRFDKPGRYTIVARATRNQFFTPWSAPAVVTAIAPFDIERVAFPDSRGPSYKIRGTVRERAAHGSRVTIYIAKKWKGGKFRRIGRAKVNSKGRFTKRFSQRGYGKHRLRYTFKGNSLVAAGRVTQRVTIRKRFFFG